MNQNKVLPPLLQRWEHFVLVWVNYFRYWKGNMGLNVEYYGALENKPEPALGGT